MKKPNFFIIGAPKCGTTAMATWLSKHPDVFVSPVKEPHYFGEEHRLTKTLEEYEALFSNAPKNAKWVCEASVWYLFSDTAVSNILNYNPDSRFLVMLRNPVDMASSMHEQHRFNGNEQVESFKKALLLNDRRERGEGVGIRSGYSPTQHLAYYKSCALGWQIDRLLKNVSAEKVFFVFFDDLNKNPQKVHRSVLEFLEIDVISAGDYGKVNSAKERRFYFLDRIVLALASVKNKMGFKKRMNLLSRLRRWNVNYRPRGDMDSKVKEEINKRFLEDTELLSRILGRDLTDW